MSKPTMKYKIVTGYKPGTTTPVLRPSITERRKLDTEGLVNYALKGAYVRGQYEDMKGALSGFLQAMQQGALDGYDISLSGWLRVFPMLTGSVGSDRTLNSENKLKVCITALKDLKSDIDNFSWENVDAFENVVKVNRVYSPGKDPGIIVKDKEILVNGDYLTYDGTRGDKVTLAYEGLATPLTIVPSESDFSHMKFAALSALEAVEDLTPMTFTFTIYADGAEKAPQVIEKTVIFRTAA